MKGDQLIEHIAQSDFLLYALNNHFPRNTSVTTHGLSCTLYKYGEQNAYFVGLHGYPLGKPKVHHEIVDPLQYKVLISSTQGAMKSSLPYFTMSSRFPTARSCI